MAKGAGPGRETTCRTITGRELALKALYQVETREAYAGLALDGLLNRYALDRVERALATELVYGTLRRQNTLDWMIAAHASRMPGQMTPWIRLVLRMATYQLLYMDRIPAAAAVDTAVELARRYGHAGVARFANAVLRAIARGDRRPEVPPLQADPVGHIALQHSHPEWLVRRWLARYGIEETEALCRANNETPPLTVRANRLRIDRDGLVEALAVEGVSAAPAPFAPSGLVLDGHRSVTGLQAFRDGLFQVQDESSILVGPIVDPQPGETVLDACSAPGGKTTHLGELMANRGRIVAADIHEHKLPLVLDNCRRLGIDIVSAVCADARTLAGVYRGAADRVLVDAPCSGLGVLRRRPDARWRKTAAQIDDLPALQLDILRGTAACVRPGGILVYSTCTIEPGENEQVVEAFLAEEPSFRRDDLRPYLPKALREEPGVDGGELHLFPHRHGTDGFYVCRLVRR